MLSRHSTTQLQPQPLPLSCDLIFQEPWGHACNIHISVNSVPGWPSCDLPICLILIFGTPISFNQKHFSLEHESALVRAESSSHGIRTVPVENQAPIFGTTKITYGYRPGLSHSLALEKMQNSLLGLRLLQRALQQVAATEGSYADCRSRVSTVPRFSLSLTDVPFVTCILSTFTCCIQFTVLKIGSPYIAQLNLDSQCSPDGLKFAIFLPLLSKCWELPFYEQAQT